jgi:hypothetical protein
MSWQNRIVGYGEEAPDQLLANPLNWRTHPKKQQDALSGVLNEVGLVQNVIVNRTTGHMIDGHARVLLAMREEQPSVPITYVDLTEAEEAKVLAVLDPIGGLAGMDDERLDELLANVHTDDPALQDLLDSLRGVDREDTERIDAGEGESSGSQGQYLKFGDVQVPMSDDELQGMRKLLAQYESEFGMQFGFVSYLQEGRLDAES